MSALATPADVRRVLRMTVAQASDASVQPALDAVTSWLGERLPEYDATLGTTTYLDVEVPSDIYLAVPGASVVEIRTRDGAVIPSSSYDVTRKFVRVRYGTSWPQRSSLLVGGSRSYVYDLLKLDWMRNFTVPQAIVEGAALTAAAYWLQGPQLATGMRTERLGDYSYTLSDKDVEQMMPPKAKALLGPFLNRRRVTTT